MTTKVQKDEVVTFDYNSKKRLGHVNSDFGNGFYLYEAGLDYPKHFLWEKVSNFKSFGINADYVDLTPLRLHFSEDFQMEFELIGNNFVVYHNEEVVKVDDNFVIKDGVLFVNGMEQGFVTKQMLDWAKSKTQ